MTGHRWHHSGSPQSVPFVPSSGRRGWRGPPVPGPARGCHRGLAPVPPPGWVTMGDTPGVGDNGVTPTDPELTPRLRVPEGIGDILGTSQRGPGASQEDSGTSGWSWGDLGSWGFGISRFLGISGLFWAPGGFGGLVGVLGSWGGWDIKEFWGILGLFWAPGGFGGLVMFWGPVGVSGLQWGWDFKDFWVFWGFWGVVGGFRIPWGDLNSGDSIVTPLSPQCHPPPFSS